MKLTEVKNKNKKPDRRIKQIADLRMKAIHLEHEYDILNLQATRIRRQIPKDVFNEWDMGYEEHETNPLIVKYKKLNKKAFAIGEMIRGFEDKADKLQSDIDEEKYGGYDPYY
jgi:hypothetical protein